MTVTTQCLASFSNRAAISSLRPKSGTPPFRTSCASCAFEPETAFRLEALRIIGSVVAGRDASPTSSPPIPTSLQSDFEAALAEAMGIATKLIATEQLTPGKSMECLAVIAALRKNTNLAMHIFLSGGAELSCPTCGEPIDFVEKA